MGDLPQIGGESAVDFFGKTGMLPVIANDSRRFPRFYFRTCAEATIYPVGNVGEPEHCFVLTRDISRNGVGLLHAQQLFPGQRLDLILNGEPPRATEVVRCRRLEDGCYEVGCRFAKA